MKSFILPALFLLSAVIFSCTQSTELVYPHQTEIVIGGQPSIIHLDYQQAALLNESVTIKFEGTGPDSRCPVDAVCVWAGDCEVNLSIITDGQPKIYTLHTGLEPREVVIGGYLIQLVNLFPSQRTDRRIRENDYNIELRIVKYPEADIQPVQLIDANYSGIIRRDAMSAGNPVLENNILSISAGYSGGCRNHLIELFALKEIIKTNPAQVTLYLSHFADGDVCLAYITKTINFDLSSLKTFLKNNYNITDRVILNIIDTSGRQLKNPGLEYKF